MNDVNSKFTFIFSLFLCIISGNDMHTFRVQVKGIQLSFDTSCLSIYKSDKQDSKALSSEFNSITYNTDT